MDSLIEEIQTLIVEVLELEDVAPADIKPDMPLFGDGLELDSIDALEIGVAIQKRFDLTLDGDDPAIREHFASVASLAALVASRGS
jgi:acyl carrier protein